VASENDKDLKTIYLTFFNQKSHRR